MSEKSRTIMLGFHSPVDGRLLRGWLRGLGYEVVESLDDTAGIDLAFIDAATARRLMDKAFGLKRAAKYFLPILVCINAGEDFGRWLNAGFDDVLRLPATKDEWQARIDIMLRLRRQSEELGQKSEYLHRALIESSVDHIFLLDENGTYVTSNDRVAHVGLDRGDKIVGKTIEQVYPEGVAAVYREQFQRVLTEGKTVVFKHDLPSVQDTYHHLDTFYPVNLPDGTVMVGGVCRDITEQVRAEEDRRVLEMAINNAQECIMVSDQENRLTYVNRSFEQLTGYSASEALGNTLGMLKSGQHDRTFYQNLKKTIYAGHPWQGSLTFKKKSGDLYEVYASITPILDHAGIPEHFVSVHRDITRERELEQRIQQNQRLEAIGTLAAGIAHDFNNLLTPIIGYTALCMDNLPTGSKVKEDLEEVMRPARRATDLVRQILSFSRRSNREQKPFRVASVVKEALKLLRAIIPTSIDIHQEISGATETVVADPTEIHQVVMNLCTNAFHAMPDGGDLTVTLKAVDLDRDASVLFPDSAPGRYLNLSVEDTGLGIDPEIRDKIFEPYFTTKEEGRGTGLGLAVTHSIVSACGGGITVHSEPGKGTRFNLYFPVAEDTATEVVEKATITGSGHESILFIDDDAVIVSLGKRTLERCGYSVTTSMDPVQALELFKKAPADFDMVITDMTMPVMTGDLLTEALLKIRPDLPVIVCTGFSERMNKEKAQEMGIRRLLDKPVEPGTLLATIRESFDCEEC